MENLKKEIDLSKIDFIVANHGECDHSGSLTALMDEIPNTPIYCTGNAVKSIEGQYGKPAAAFGCYGWSGESVKLLQAKLAETGFETVEENIRSMWNPEETDLEAVPTLVTSLLHNE